MEKLTQKQQVALLKAANSVFSGDVVPDPADLEIYFVDKLPMQPWGDYTAKCWGKNKIYISKKHYANLPEMMSFSKGRELLCHEFIHQIQIQRLGGWIPFALHYLKGYVLAGFSYRNNYLEAEAYLNQSRFREVLDVAIL